MELLLIPALLLYVLPLLIAGKRGVAADIPVCLLNLLLGWTIVGWLAALVWAMLGAKRQAATE